MPDLFWMSVVSGGVLTLFGIFAAVLWGRSHQFRHWSTTEGKIIAARSAFQSNRPGDSNFDSSDSELLNVPRIEFEYQVEGKTLCGSRISLVAHDPRYHPAKATLARYPVGKIVPVYFDPQDPKNAALERSFTSYDYKMFGLLLAIGLLVPWLIAIYLTQVYLQIKPRVVDPGPAHVITGIIGFGTVFVILSVGAIGTVIKSWFWPATTGRIQTSSVASFRVSGDEWVRTAYKPRVVYTYELRGQKYTGDRISFSFVLGGMTERKAKRIAARYRAKDEVQVFYNPRRPEESVLRRTAGGMLLFPFLAALFLGVAWAMAR